MLNNEKLEKILKVQLPKVVLNDIHWRTQESTPESILFYKINDDQKSEDLFVERIKQASFGYLIVNRKMPSLPEHSLVIEESEWPKVQSLLLDVLYPLPVMKFIGITGTNGKTTTTDLILQLGHLIGKKGLSIGTLGVREYNKTILDFGLTSPSLIDLRKFLNQYGKDKDFCVMEASSHALIQERLFGINFDAAGWLSFSQDHLDYHQTMDGYYEAKSLILKKIKDGSKLFAPSEQVELLKKLKQSSSKSLEAPLITEHLPLFFHTQFNKNNLEVAVAILQDLYLFDGQFPFEKIIPPDGRFYIRPYLGSYIIVDFAHTPDALENICLGIKKTFPGYALKVLFGCGGDRDRTKRPIMAEVVGRYADEIYVTSDNPRNEDPEQIISDILRGLSGKKFQAITDRISAVKMAFSELMDKEVLLLAGKGHEDYILKNGVKHPYSDIREVDEFIGKEKND